MVKRPPPAELRALALLLAAPAEESLEAVRGLAVHQPWLAPVLEELEREPLAHWQAEHTRLFISGFPRTPCPPFASAWREGQLHGHAAMEQAGLYGRAGLAPAPGLPADYLGTTLEFAAHLLERGDPDAAGLLRELWEGHLVNWIPAFGDTLEQESRLQLYRAVGARLQRLFSGESHA
ncbi:TorD/DmsD family molecular chaperone [Thioalbus denitrificans]|uniref:TorA maturation chaperone TorD n=1 Tax=Thioalbus denitrificans TaxID=547122 RepID=A0A369CI92_9GAMM|nr:molecular chaperone TorD family protein [Thioalbus denitrificans]RCX32167.1 TorA maturation chaperone TorD [Thioalbus denitrificans]